MLAPRFALLRRPRREQNETEHGQTEADGPVVVPDRLDGDEDRRQREERDDAIARQAARSLHAVIESSTHVTLTHASSLAPLLRPAAKRRRRLARRSRVAGFCAGSRELMP